MTRRRGARPIFKTWWIPMTDVMQAVRYEANGAAPDVLMRGEIAAPKPGPARLRLVYSDASGYM